MLNLVSGSSVDIDLNSSVARYGSKLNLKLPNFSFLVYVQVVFPWWKEKKAKEEDQNKLGLSSAKFKLSY